MISFKQIFEIKNRLNPVLFFYFFGFCLLVATAEGQTKQKKNESKETCKIGTTIFRCPEDFTQEQMIGEDTIFYKQDYEGSITYFFVSVPSGKFDDGKIKEVIGSKFSNGKSDAFLWKEVKELLVMNLKSRYEKKVASALGFDNKTLLNFVSRYFEYKNQPLIFGYGYKTDSEGNSAKRFFESGSAIGDNAIGCNTIATTLNSITKESKDILQYCYLTGISTGRQ